MNNQILCPHCGQNIAEVITDQIENVRKENLTKGLVDTLIKFIEAIKIKGRNEIHLQTDIELDKNAYNNFQKLRYHGLVHHCKEADGTIKAGYWLITRLGGQFLRNEVEISRAVYVADNHIVGYGDGRVKIIDFFNKDVYPHDYWQKKFNVNIHQSRLL